MVKECTLSTGNLSPGGFPRYSVVRIIDRPDMTSAVNRLLKATNQPTNQHLCNLLRFFTVVKIDYLYRIPFSVCPKFHDSVIPSTFQGF